MKKLTKKILILFNLAAALALCGAYLSNIIDPAFIWQFAFFGLAYPVLLITNIGFFIFWWWRKRKIALLSLFCILIGFGNLGRYMQLRFSNNKDASQNALKIISYNVRLFNHFEWEEGISVRDSIIEYLKDESPDIICFQEFLVRKDRKLQSKEHIVQELSSTPYHHINYSRELTQGSSQFGQATFSKYPIVNKGVILFENSPNSCIYSDIDFGSDTLRIYNLHLQSTRLKKYDEYLIDSLFHFNSSRLNDYKALSSRLKKAFIKRSEQVKIIKGHMNESPFPIILCGDFNDTPVSYTYHQLLGKKKDSFRESGSGISKTYRGKLPSYRIDYIFFSACFRSTDYRVDNKKLSDHYPVVCTLKSIDTNVN